MEGAGASPRFLCVERNWRKEIVWSPRGECSRVKASMGFAFSARLCIIAWSLCKIEWETLGFVCAHVCVYKSHRGGTRLRLEGLKRRDR